MERTRRTTAHPDPAGVVEYVVVPSAMGDCLPSTALGALSGAYPATAASGKEASGCHRNHADICLDRFARWLCGLRQSPLAGIHGFVPREDSRLRLGSGCSSRRPKAPSRAVAPPGGLRSTF